MSVAGEVYREIKYDERCDVVGEVRARVLEGEKASNDAAARGLHHREEKRV